MAADKNGDGRIDADELQALLKRHKSSFTDREIADIGAAAAQTRRRGLAGRDGAAAAVSRRSRRRRGR